MFVISFSAFDATTSATPSASHLRSSSAPTAAPALPTPWHDGTTIVVAAMAAFAVLVVGLALLWRSCRVPDEKTMRTASVAVAASGGRESTDSVQTEPSWIVAFDQQLIEDDANERAAAKLAAESVWDRAAAKFATAPTSEFVWLEIGTPTLNMCGKCGRADFVDATSFGMRCPACYGLLDSEENSIDV
ncbi:Aste57867_1226 [Aphanomyces stellatus]|uniref:Aste57867_1226 protein n=1 Tax=Aphanomyces stellatus TaxID=120398 RepID=A0A485K536_9STRA|nr:hypothetical protein As57867_001225 [Aphanomyces stellatus]VFT78446.1 Aste57867_1226 [Aphanomyces stellatus]